MRSDPSSPSPLTFDLSVVIARPADAVFDLLADIQDAEPIPRDAAVRMVKDPIGATTVGTRWHEWVKIAPRWWLHTESIATEVRRPYRLGMDFDSTWLTGHLTYEVEPVDGGCVLHHRETVRARPHLRWLQSFVERTMRPRLLRRLSDIKEILESGP